MQNYTILEKLGSGSYSTVYKAKDNRTQRLVALKIMKFPYSKGKRLQDMELKALKKFRHNPCVIQIVQDFIENDVMAMAFELGGMTLIDYYRKCLQSEKKTMSEQDIKVISFQLAMVLSDLHKSNYMHRDLKPQNILIDPATKHIKVVDFGLCKRWETPANTNYVTTRWYRSPELILNLPYSVNVDVFALGCIMIELYLGYEAFPGKDAIDQLNKVFSVTGTPGKEVWPEGMEYLENKRIIFPQYEKADLKFHMPKISDTGVDLISKTIECNPKKRISSSDCLSHPYFHSLPRQSLPAPIQAYLLQQRPTPIHNPLQLSMPKTSKNSGSTQASSSRKGKRKLELVSASISEVRERRGGLKGSSESYIPNSDREYGHYKDLLGSGEFMMHTCQSTRTKRKLNLTILEGNTTTQAKTGRFKWLNSIDMTNQEQSCDALCQPKEVHNLREPRYLEKPGLDRFMPRNTRRGVLSVDR